MRPVATAIASGSLTSLVFNLARDLIGERLELVLPSSAPLPPLTSDLCTLIRPAADWHLDLYSFLVGTLVGLTLSAALDLLIVARIHWARFVQAQTSAAAGARPLYRILS